ncbi:peptide ABC transporter substrate-binding protein [Weissella confusa]|uniref:peptide ABC transporter substrate-binding protein n=1 Tax=Weissella confusa TaxID=1583 RepID=UPI0018F1CC63|nr:peptide ABC transporter substrate-binding protein [Weissella confusa]MBJ7643969.1 peptide ABC transporter substrate-binding protein [Weissella confusa]MCT0023744.1 peptide ABC transporter substrate-binding protein [Weissella confusa]
MNTKTLALMTLATATLGWMVTPAGDVAASDKIINWTQSADLSTLDPSRAPDVASSQIIDQSGQGLYRSGKNNEPKLADAKKVDVSEDGKTWIITLRDNLKWSNGDPVTAQDYVYGWQRTIDPKNASTSANLMYNIENAKALNTGEQTDLSALGIKALDDKTLQINLLAPEPMMAKILTEKGFYPQNQAFEAKVGDKYGSTSTDTLYNGPFKVVGWNGSNKSYRLVKNKYYIDAKQVKPKEVHFQTVTDSSTGYNLYQSNKVDYTELSATQIKGVKGKAGYHQIKQARTQYLAFNVKTGILSNQTARQAMQRAINKAAMVKNVMSDSATMSKTFTPVGIVTDPKTKTDFAKANAVKNTGYNTKEAKRLWQKAMKQEGLKKTSLTLLADNDDSSKNQAQFLQSQLESHLPGLQVTVKTQPKTARVKAMLSSQFEMVLVGWNGDYADPLAFLANWQTGATANFGNWTDENYDAALTAAQTTDVMDNEARMADLGRAEKIYQTQVPATTLFDVTNSVMINPKVTGVQINTVGATFDFTKAVKK